MSNDAAGPEDSVTPPVAEPTEGEPTEGEPTEGEPTEGEDVAVDAAAVALPEESADDDADDDYGAPFIAKTFGGAFVWARGDGFVATVLRVHEGKSVPVATQNRRDMHIMLTGGRAVLEVDSGGEVDRVELLPASPIPVSSENAYRLIAMTEVELFTVFSQG